MHLASISALRRFGLSNNVTISNELTLRDCSNSVIATGEVQILKDLSASIENKDVLIIEDILETGTTLKSITVHKINC
jgi:hypoxanthine-guanine phosphoribosyltransferase